jgi:hypothetical protein
MPDLTGLPALDVLIGMSFLFFLLATVVASVNEVIQTVLNARARTLTRGIKTLLGDDAAAEEFFEEWRIKRLAKPAGAIRTRVRDWGFVDRRKLVAERRRPSYIPARTFALTLLETATRDTDPKIGVDLFDKAEKTIEKIGVPSLRRLASEGLTEAQALLDATRAELEHAFDEVMDRASGWYKRYVQWWLLALAVVVAVGLNVNTFTVAERLWKDDALRAAVVQQAQQSAGESGRSPAAATPKDVADEIDKIDQLKLPIGWDEANTGGNFWGRLAGWLVTAAAITLGAPFWFDVLGKLSRLRGTGNREGTEKDDSRAPEDRDDPSRRRPAAG